MKDKGMHSNENSQAHPMCPKSWVNPGTIDREISRKYFRQVQKLVILGIESTFRGESESRCHAGTRSAQYYGHSRSNENDKGRWSACENEERLSTK